MAQNPTQNLQGSLFPDAVCRDGPVPGVSCIHMEHEILVPGPSELVLEVRVKKILFSKDDFHLVLGTPCGVSRRDVAFANLSDIVTAGVWDQAPEKGLEYRLVGRFETYKGRRSFRFRLALLLLDRTAKGIETWLRRQDIDGLGVTRIRRIAKAAVSAGDNALGDVEFLVKCGLKPDLADHVAALWELSGLEARVKALLYSFGVRNNTAQRIWEAQGTATLEILESNPWELCLSGFLGFETCDRLAQKAGIALDSPARTKAAILEAFRQASHEGHTALPWDDLIVRAGRIAEIFERDVRVALDALCEEGRIIRLYGQLVQSRERWFEEQRLADALRNPFRRAVVASRAEADDAIKEAERSLGVSLDREGGQYEAAVMILTSPLSIITGGPGTGKTTTQSVVVEALRLLGRKPLLLSPTGRAAKRLEEATSARAHTIAKIHHTSRGGTVSIKEDRQDVRSPPDIAIVDESSMLCLDGALQLVSFLPETTAIVFSGDIDQLPSVGPGAVLRDIISSGICPVVRLEKIHRQAEGNDIPVAARQILSGRAPLSSTNVKVEDCEDDRLEEMLCQSVLSLLEQGFSREDIQVLVPMKRGTLGSHRLNDVLRPLLNPLSDSLGNNQTGPETRVFAGFRYAIMDRVMNTKNDYERGVMNGEIGTIIDFKDDGENMKILVDFDGEIVTYNTKDDADNDFPLMPCYATTVHKSQGCEFPVVVFAAPRAHGFMMNRSIIYTALTRAKSICHIIGSQRTLAQACIREERIRRFTNLTARLSQVTRNIRDELDEL